jgi:hypothetical protein
VKFACLFGLVGILVVTHPASAATRPPTEIRLDGIDRLPLAFEIRSERLANGELEFTVKVSARTTKLPESYFIGLGRVHITESSARFGPTVRKPSVREGNFILCVFTVTDKELENPELAFYFSMPLERPAGVGSGNSRGFYARLQNFVKP